VTERAYHSDEWVAPKTYRDARRLNKTRAVRKIRKNVHVSQRIGNSLCSHPALLMSALGGIVILS
jgi:hypothetical protein